MRLAIISMVLMFVFSVEARNTKHMFNVHEAMTNEAAKEKLDSSIKYYFGTKNKKKPRVAKNFGEFKSNKKTNAFNKTDKAACQWAFLSALRSFESRAKKMGGNAVINIRSVYKNQPIDSTTEFECGAGAFIAGVALKGDVVKLK